MVNRRWQDWLILLGGVWLFVAPWALGTSGDAASSQNAWVLGILLAGTAWWALGRPSDKTPEWLQVLYGVWLFVSPWVLGFSGLAAASWNALLVGVGVFAVALWAVSEMASASKRMMTPHGGDHDHMAHGSH